MQYLNLDTIKAHLNIMPDYTDEDLYLIQLGDTAEIQVKNLCDTDLIQFTDECGNLQEPLIQAMLLYVGTLYNDRETDVHSSIVKHPHGVEYLLAPYRNFGQHNFVKYAQDNHGRRTIQ